MGRVIGILLIVIAIWLGLEALNGQGPSRDPEQAAAGLVERTGERVRHDLEAGNERREALLPE